MQFQLSPKYHLMDVLISIAKAVTIVSVSAVVTILAAKMVGGASLSVNQVSTQKQTTFDVTGQSEITAIPDEASIQMGVTVSRPTVAQAQNEINQIINQITQDVKSLGIDKEDIKTSNYNIYPNYNYESANRNITSYTATTNINVKIKNFETLNQVIDAGTAAGANQVSGVSFNLSQEKEEQIKKQAREEAINEAKENAKELSRLAGMKLGKIVNIYETPEYNQPYPMMERAMLSSDAGLGGGAPTEIQPGSTSYNYSVTLSFETL